ncbi:DNA/RNA helicase domain-containing protein [Humibacter ginsengisoli]
MGAARNMTSFSIERLPFDDVSVKALPGRGPRFINWPVVYMLDDDKGIYVGESLNVTQRMRQHLDTPSKNRLRRLRVILDDEFNKSAALDLESYLIGLLAGDGRFEVLNGNAGITDADYFRRSDYRKTFSQIFDELLAEGVFTRSIREIENRDLFKLSPFKALTRDQAIAVEDILDGLFHDLSVGATSTIVVQGEPGTGKTVLGIYLIKLLMDIRSTLPEEPVETDSMFSELFVPENAELLADLNVGLVIPQGSLRQSVADVFAKTSGLTKKMVLSPFEVGSSETRFHLLIVDETHRLTQRANQSAGPLNKKFTEINQRLFGDNDLGLTQLDWIRKQSDHQILLLDAAQTVRPADLPRTLTRRLVTDAQERHRWYPLTSQMRLKTGDDFVSYIRDMLSEHPPAPKNFEPYDFRFFDDLGALESAIRRRNAEEGLSRLVAGYAWPWRSKKDPSAFDIELDGLKLRWNKTVRDWINSPTSIDEVGSIHTVQGYDLNYCGVIIGADLRYDPEAKRLYADLANYHDVKGKENNKVLGITYSADDILKLIENIYAVLLTRGIHGTYVYVVDPELRKYIREFVPAAACPS